MHLAAAGLGLLIYAGYRYYQHRVNLPIITNIDIKGKDCF